MTSSPGRALLADVLRRRRRTVLAVCLAATTHQACEALVPVAIGLAVDRAVDGGSWWSVALAVAGVLLLFAVLATGGGVSYWLLSTTNLREAHALRVRALGRVLAEPAADRQRRPGELVSVLTSDAKATADVAKSLAHLVSGAAGLAVAVVVLLRLDPALGLGALLVIPALVLGIDRLAPGLERAVRARQQTGGRAAGLAAELVQALRPLRGFGGVPEAVRRYQQASRRSLDATLQTASASAVVAGAGLLGTGIVLIATTTAAGLMTLSGRLSVGEFVTAVAMASFIGDPVRRIAAGVEQAAVSRAGSERLAVLLPPPGPKEPMMDENHELVGALTFDEVTARSIHGLSFALRPGEVLGLAATDPRAVATVVSLLTGRREPDSGQVRLGSVSLHRLDHRLRRRHLLLDPPGAYLLGGSPAAALDSGRELEPGRPGRSAGRGRGRRGGQHAHRSRPDR